jgi:hypothetical protein
VYCDGLTLRPRGHRSPIIVGFLQGYRIILDGNYSVTDIVIQSAIVTTRREELALWPPLIKISGKTKDRL